MEPSRFSCSEWLPSVLAPQPTAAVLTVAAAMTWSRLCRSEGLYMWTVKVVTGDQGGLILRFLLLQFTIFSESTLIIGPKKGLAKKNPETPYLPR